MQRSIHIPAALLCVLLLVQPFDCFSGGQFTQKAADCCKKGKCVPSANADDCCKGTLPVGKQLVESKAPHYSAPALDVVATIAHGPIAPTFAILAFAHVETPPGSPPNSRLDLPLLI